MTIQIPNPGTGDGHTGDNELVMWTKVGDNFSNQAHAASRLVGTAAGEVMEVGAFGVGGYQNTTRQLNKKTAAELIATLLAQGSGFFRNIYATDINGGYASGIFANTSDTFFGLSANHNSPIITAFSGIGNTVSAVMRIWHDKNTTKDSNGFIKAASPIVKVFADRVELNDDAASQDVTFVKNGVGDYTINTVSGLSTDGWYIELPKDMNGNPKVAVTLEETNGVISLKSYKRIFSMETFTFVPDLDEPMDVPDGRWIDLRLNEIPHNDLQPDEV